MTGTRPVTGKGSEIFEIREYMIILRQLESLDFDGQEIHLRGIVRCLGDDAMLDVYFLEEGSPFPQPVVNLEERKGTLFLPFRDISVLIDLLRNEKPVYAHLRADRLSWTSITTNREPVGEGE